MIHLKNIFRIIGSLLLLLAGIFFLFGIASPFLEGNDLFGFLASALTTTFVGLWCRIIGKGCKAEFSRRDSYITITACWVAFGLFGSLPYWLGGHIPSFTDAFFAGFGEADEPPVMAWAVVGLSVFTFVLFDLLIDRLLVIYYIRWKKRVDKWMKP